jgi:NDP-sugar pyrophosphorylase family protein
MKIVIPMSGLGSRFIEAGYQDPKPLIKVNGKPIIEYVINLFPGETDFIFVCREEHLNETNMAEVLKKLMPSGEIVSIPGHKLGPVYAVAQVLDRIDDNEPVITNYCDFYMDWDYADFKKVVEETACAGAIPSYTGFHPHLLPEKNVYAGCRVDEQNNLLEIKEKFSFTQDKTKSHHSGGTYYFGKGQYVKKYFTQMMEEKIQLNGEYYISLVYPLMLRDNLNVLVYDKIPHFCQWGTPEDLEEYNYWRNIFKSDSK